MFCDRLANGCWEFLGEIVCKEAQGCRIKNLLWNSFGNEEFAMLVSSLYRRLCLLICRHLETTRQVILKL